MLLKIKEQLILHKQNSSEGELVSILQRSLEEQLL